MKVRENYTRSMKRNSFVKA